MIWNIWKDIDFLVGIMWEIAGNLGLVKNQNHPQMGTGQFGTPPPHFADHLLRSFAELVPVPATLDYCDGRICHDSPSAWALGSQQLGPQDFPFRNSEFKQGIERTHFRDHKDYRDPRLAHLLNVVCTAYDHRVSTQKNCSTLRTIDTGPASILIYSDHEQSRWERNQSNLSTYLPKHAARWICHASRWWNVVKVS